MPDLTPEKLAELRRLLDAATPGPWRDEMMQGKGVTLTAIIAGRPNPDDLRVIGSTLAHNDARVLIAAVNALPALLDAAAERDRLAATVERVRALHHEGAPFVRPGGQDRRCSCGGRWPCPTIRALDGGAES